MNRPLRVLGTIFAATGIQLACLYAPVATAASVTIGGISITDPSCTSSFTLVGQSLTCNGAPPSGNAPVCTLNPSNGNPAVGASFVLTAQCSNSPTSYTWSGPGVVASTGSASTQTVTATSSATYSVTASNASGSGSAQTYVTVGSVPPAPSGPVACSGFSNTKVIDAAFPANGAPAVKFYTYESVFSQGQAGWGANDVVVVRFVAPAPDSFLALQVSASNSPNFRSWTLSTQPCEFAATANTIASGVANDIAVSLASGVPGNYPSMTPGQTYYLNLANRWGTQSTCTSNTCDAVIVVQNPLP
jgi:hypothetical protein